MFYGNSQLLEKTLHNDINVLVKNVKTREDQHLTLLQYNKTLIEQLSEMDSIPFFQEQLAKHRSFLDSTKETHSKIKEEQDQMIEKYVGTFAGQSSIMKLMGRVTARVIQILQASLQKSKNLDDTLQKAYVSVKADLFEHGNKEKIDIQGYLEIIINHVNLKSKKEIERLEKIIQILIEGDFSKLCTVYNPPVKKVQPKISIEKKQPKDTSVRKKVLDKSREKRKQQAMQNEKKKKKKSKLANRMITGFYSTMQLSRQQFMEDMVFTNKQQKKKQLFDEIFSRNKFNYSQIIEFESKREQFEEKVKIFKEKMERESQKIQQALVFVKPKPVDKVKQHTISQTEIQSPTKKPELSKNQTKSETAEEFLMQECQIISPQRAFRRRQKLSLHKAPSPKIIKETTYASMHSTQQGFHHLKFDPKNQQLFSRSNRARLPQISGRSSLDTRCNNGKSTKKEQGQKRINIMKNVEIGAFNPQLIPVGSEKSRKSPRQKSRQGNNGVGFEYTFYVKKKTNRFYETKNNFML